MLGKIPTAMRGAKGIVSICILVISVISIAKVAKGKDANLPFACKFSNWAYGLIVQKVYTTTEQV